MPIFSQPAYPLYIPPGDQQANLRSIPMALNSLVALGGQGDSRTVAQQGENISGVAAKYLGGEYRAVCLAILLLGAGLRLYQLSADSLWGDELGTLLTASAERDSLSILLEPFLSPAELPHLPLFSLLTHFFLRLGENDFIIRFPSFLFGTACIASTYTVGKILWGPKVGLVGSFLLALSSFHIRYSQEARYPILVTFLSLLTLLFFLRALRRQDFLPWIGFVVTTVLNLYTFLLSPIVLGVEGLYFFVIRFRKKLSAADNSPGERKDRTLLYFLASLVLIFLFSLPLLAVTLSALSGPKGLGAAPHPERALLGLDYFGEMLSLWGMGGGVPLLLFSLATVAGLAVAAKDEKQALFLSLLWLLLPLLITLGLPFQNVFRLRFLLFVLPVFLLLTARGLVAISQWLANFSLLRQVHLPLVAGIFGLLSLFPVSDYYLEGKQDWRAVAGYLESHVSEGGLVVMAKEERLLDALEHYGYGGEVVQFSASASAPASSEIWVVSLPGNCQTAQQRITWVAEYFLSGSVVFPVPQEGINPLAKTLIGPKRYLSIYVCHFQNSG